MLVRDAGPKGEVVLMSDSKLHAFQLVRCAMSLWAIDSHKVGAGAARAGRAREGP